MGKIIRKGVVYMSNVDQLNNDVQALKLQCEVHEQRLNRTEKEIEQLHAENKAIYEINTNVKILAEGMSIVKKDVLDVKEDVKQNNAKISKLGEKFDNEEGKIWDEVSSIKQQPYKAKAAWWDKVVWLVVGGIVSAVVTAVIAALWK